MEILALEILALEIRALEIRALEILALEIRALEILALEIRALEILALEIRALRCRRRRSDQAKPFGCKGLAGASVNCPGSGGERGKHGAANLAQHVLNPVQHVLHPVKHVLDGLLCSRQCRFRIFFFWQSSFR